MIEIIIGVFIGFIIGMGVFASLKAGKCSDCTLNKIKETKNE